MNKIKKILPIIFGIGLLNVCFGLTGAAQTTEITQNYQVNKNEEKKYSVQFEYGFKYVVYGSGANDTEEMKKKREVNNSLALYVMVKQALAESNNAEIKKNLDFYLDFIASGNLLNPTKKVCVLSSGESSEMKIEDANELKRILTMNNLKRFEITEAKFYEAKQILKGKIEVEISKFANSNNPDVVKILQNNLNEVNNADLSSVKSAASNLTNCELKIFESKPVEVKS